MNLSFVTFPMLPVRPSWTTRPTSRSIIAHTMVRDALECGILEKQSCCVCGSQKADAHHEDYQKPNVIVWLCSLHHRKRHADLGWGVRGGTEEYYLDSRPKSTEIHWPTGFGSFPTWSTTKQQAAIENKEAELLWLLQHYECVKFYRSPGTPKALRNIILNAIQKFNLISFTLDEFERIEAPGKSSNLPVS